MIMGVYEMLDEIFNELKEEILNDPAQAEVFNENLLKIKVNGAFRDVKQARNYPKTYSEERINEDMLDYFSNIKDIARYDYGNGGSEGLSSYSADGVSIHYLSRDSLFNGVYRISR